MHYLSGYASIPFRWLYLMVLLTGLVCLSASLPDEHIERLRSVKSETITYQRDLAVHFDALDTLIQKYNVEDKDWMLAVFDKGMALNDSLSHSVFWSYYVLLYKAERYEEALKFSNTLIEYSENNGFNVSGDFYVEAGLLYSNEGDYTKQFEYFDKAQQAYLRDSSENITYALSTTGNLYEEVGNYDKAMELHLKALEYAEGMKNEHAKYYNITNKYLSIATLSDKQGDHTIAKEYFHKAVKFGEKQNNLDLRLYVYSLFIKYLIQQGDAATGEVIDAAIKFREDNAGQFKSEYLSYLNLNISNYGLKYNKQDLLIEPEELLNATLTNETKREIYTYASDYYSLRNNLKKTLEYKTLKEEVTILELEKLRASTERLVLGRDEIFDLQNQVKELEYENEMRNGILYFISTLMIMFTLFVVMLFRDNYRIKELNNDIASKKEKIVGHYEELERIAYVMTHDLKEPANTIKSFTELIQKKHLGELNPKTNQLFDVVQKTSSSMINTIGMLHNYLLVGITSDLGVVNTDEVYNEVLTNLAGVIRENNVVTKKNVKLPTLNAYRSDLVKLFQSIMSNAIKYSHPKRTPEIIVDYIDQPHHHCFSISDNGIGISQEKQTQIFDLFKRLHLKEEIDGSGIGLANARKIAELHNGELWVESEVGYGSTFFFTISKTLEG